MDRVFRLDYVSCVLTIASTVLVGKKLWQGWVVAGANSVLISIIGVRTEQLGFVPANMFCVAMSAYNLWNWRTTRGGTAEIAEKEISLAVAAQTKRDLSQPPH